MGIVEELLADFETPDGQHYRMELNHDGTIHIHTEHIRIDLTKEEFLQVAERVVEGRDKLKETKDGL